MSYPIDRAFYRIRFPISERPRLQIADASHDVVDCSEAGVRYLIGSGPLPDIGAEVAGTVMFTREGPLDVAGKVVRVQGRTVALHLDRAGIPLAVIMAEQRYLRLHYPMFDG
jgi:hypothetical protein